MFNRLLNQHVGKKHASGTFGEALQRAEVSTEANPTTTASTKRYWRFCVQALLENWPGLKETKLAKLTKGDGEAKFSAIAGKISPQYHNNVLTLFRKVLKEGGVYGPDDPTAAIKRLGVGSRKSFLTLEQLQKLIAHMEGSNVWKTRDAADLVKFLAFTGCRISEAGKVRWQDVNSPPGFITIHNAKLRNHHRHETTRLVPIISPLLPLLEKLKKANPGPDDPVCKFSECEKALTHACAAVGVERVTHHALRHSFASLAFKHAVDPVTLASWLGHKDGGGLAMRVYGHADKEHSLKAAKAMSAGLNAGGANG